MSMQAGPDIHVYMFIKDGGFLVWDRQLLSLPQPTHFLVPASLHH